MCNKRHAVLCQLAEATRPAGLDWDQNAWILAAQGEGAREAEPDEPVLFFLRLENGQRTG